MYLMVRYGGMTEKSACAKLLDALTMRSEARHSAKVSKITHLAHVLTNGVEGVLANTNRDRKADERG